LSLPPGFAITNAPAAITTTIPISAKRWLLDMLYLLG
jgi:hypothetical protein